MTPFRQREGKAIALSSTYGVKFSRSEQDGARGTVDVLVREMTFFFCDQQHDEKRAASYVLFFSRTKYLTTVVFLGLFFCSSNNG